MYPDGESNQGPFGLQGDTQPTELHQSGPFIAYQVFFNIYNVSSTILGTMRYSCEHYVYTSSLLDIDVNLVHRDEAPCPYRGYSPVGERTSQKGTLSAY